MMRMRYRFHHLPMMLALSGVMLVCGTAQPDRIGAGISAARAAGNDATALACRQATTGNHLADDCAELGAALLQRGDTKLAEAVLRDSLRLKPGAERPANLLVSLYVDQKRFDDAAALMREAARVNPADPRPPYMLGLIFTIQKQYAAAADAYRQSLHLRPDDAATLTGLGTALRFQDKQAEAVEVYRKALQRAPRDPEANQGIGSILLLQGDYAGSIPPFRIAFEQMPESRSLTQAYVTALLFLKRDDENIAILRKHLAIDPTDAESQLNLGIVYLILGSNREAADHLTEATRLDPNNGKAQAALAKALDATGQPAAAATARNRAKALGYDAP